MIRNLNLYDSLYTDDDDSDVGLISLNELYEHLNFDQMSNYFSTSQYNNMLSNNSQNELSILHFNIRGLHTNLIQIEALLSELEYSPNIIAFSETWLTTNDRDHCKIDGYNSYHITREDKIHGGVSIFVQNQYNSEFIEKLSYISEHIEICTISLNINNSLYNIACIYRPHSKLEKIKEFRREISPLLKSNQFKRSNTILIGDFNINLLQHSEHQETNEFLNLMQTFNYIPLITRPTRFPEGEQTGNPSLLDHIYINFTPPSAPGILNYVITYHLPVFLNIKLPERITISHKIKFRLFSEENEIKFTRDLAQVFWEEILTEDDLKNNFDLFFDAFTKIYNN